MLKRFQAWQNRTQEVQGGLSLTNELILIEAQLSNAIIRAQFRLLLPRSLPIVCIRITRSSIEGISGKSKFSQIASELRQEGNDRAVQV